jgi:hypothetical protein
MVNNLNSTDKAGPAQSWPHSDATFKSLALGVFNFICSIYVISVMIAAPYYNWQYMREHTFADWLVWGEIAPTAKALVWPYFVLHSSTQSRSEAIQPLTQRQINEMQIMSATRAIEAAMQAHYIIDTRPLGTNLTEEQIHTVIDYETQALYSADTTDEEALNSVYPELGTRFKRDFCGGIRLFLSGLKTNSHEDLMKSGELDQVWKEWYNLNRKRIEDASNAAIQ